LNGEFDRLLTIGRGNHFEARMLEQIRDEVEVLGVVLDDQNTFTHHSSSHRIRHAILGSEINRREGHANFRIVSPVDTGKQLLPKMREAQESP
jgi:RNA-splicing ligase RtcB